MINHILQKYLDDFVAIYLDDIIIYSKTFEEHIEHVTKVLEKLREANLMIKLRKCKFFKAEISFLGHIIGRYRLKSDLKKIEKIKKLPILTDLTSLQSALGLFLYYRRFIKNFSKIAKPMNKLLKKEIPFIWTNEQEKAFKILKQKLIEASILQYLNFEKPFILFTDASKISLEVVLSQLNNEEKERVIAYVSRSLNSAKQNYPIIELECLAVIWVV